MAEAEQKAEVIEFVGFKNAKPISQTAGKIGWVSFGKEAMKKLGIDPAKNTNSQLKALVFKRLKL